MHPYGHLDILAIVVLDSWVRTIDCFFSLWACIAPLITVRTRPQSGGFQITYNSVASSPMSEVCGFFSIRSYVQVQESSKDSDNAYIILGGSSTPLASDSKPSPMPGSWVFLDGLWLLGKALLLPLSFMYFFINYIIYPYKLVSHAYQNLVELAFE